MAARLIRLGWVEQMDLGNMPNVTANLQDVYKDVTWDPTNDHHVPWQSGMTGLGYDQAKTGDLTSLDALFDLKYKGKVDYLTEMRDTIGLTMLKLGLDPSKATTADCDAAVAEIKKVAGRRHRSGRSRATSTPRTSSAATSCCRWPGPATWSRRWPTSRPCASTIADQGGMLWTDNMHDPEGRQEQVHGQVMIDFCYDPAIAAQIEAYVNYICPVKGAGRSAARRPTRTWPTTR